MTPKKPTETIEEFCRLNGYNNEDISLIIYGFWEETVRVLNGMESDNVEIPCLGSLFLKIWTIKRKVTSLDKDIEAKTRSNAPIAWVLSRKEERDRLEAVRLRMVAEYDKEMKEKMIEFDNNWKKRGKKYDPETKTVISLEEQKPDS